MFDLETHPQLSSPFIRGLGCEFSYAEGGQVRVRLPFAEHLVGNPVGPAWHGGIIMALLDIAAQAQLIAHIGQADARVRLISSHADFLRSGRAMTLYASGRVRRAGRRYASVEAICWQDDPNRATAMANVHFQMPKSEPSDGA